MTDFNAFAPNYSTPADPLAGFHGKGGRRGGKGMEGRRQEGRGGSGGRKGGGYPVFP